jgi:hypothetical protein
MSPREMPVFVFIISVFQGFVLNSLYFPGYRVLKQVSGALKLKKASE